jgi:hypothetical protein
MRTHLSGRHSRYLLLDGGVHSHWLLNLPVPPAEEIYRVG